MSALRDFVSDLLERRGAAVEALGSDQLEVLAPVPLQRQLGWPELTHLGFGTQQASGTVAITLEGDWLDRFGALMADEGRWSEREVHLPAPVRPPSDPEKLLDRVLDLPNATRRLQGMSATWTRCLMLAFRLTAVSDEKREKLIWIGFNLGTGAVISDVLAQLRSDLALADWRVPDPATKHMAGAEWSAATLAARLRPLLERDARETMEPFLRTMRRRLERDRDRVHAYHNELRDASLKRLAALNRMDGDRVEADRRRETQRVEAIEREYGAKLDDLRRNYALRVTIEWVQALEIYLPVQRFEVLIRRRKGERMIRLDWHPLVRTLERPLCEAGLGLDPVRLVCDDRLHLTDPAGHAPCSSCGKPFCRACFPGCQRCHQS